jgi:hypothetical protein
MEHEDRPHGAGPCVHGQSSRTHPGAFGLGRSSGAAQNSDAAPVVRRIPPRHGWGRLHISDLRGRVRRTEARPRGRRQGDGRACPGPRGSTVLGLSRRRPSPRVRGRRRGPRPSVAARTGTVSVINRAGRDGHSTYRDIAEPNPHGIRPELAGMSVRLQARSVRHARTSSWVSSPCPVPPRPAWRSRSPGLRASQVRSASTWSGELRRDIRSL